VDINLYHIRDCSAQPDQIALIFRITPSLYRGSQLDDRLIPIDHSHSPYRRVQSFLLVSALWSGRMTVYDVPDCLDDIVLLREFFDCHGSPTVILYYPPPLSKSQAQSSIDIFDYPPLSIVEGLEFPTADFDDELSTTQATRKPKMSYANTSFSAWINAEKLSEDKFKDWAETPVCKPGV